MYFPGITPPTISFTNSDGNDYTVQGFNAGQGYDLASGLGTFDAADLVPALSGHLKAPRRHGGQGPGPVSKHHGEGHGGSPHSPAGD